MRDSMTEYFVVANSNAAPFCSDKSTHYVEGMDAAKALNAFIAGYKHPCGLYAANLYASADDYHKNLDPIAKFRSEKAIKDAER